MWWAVLQFVKSFVFETLLPSRLGQIALAFVVAWFWSAHNTSVKYEKQIAVEKAQIEAAYQAEIQREQYAAREIAEAATRRAEDDADAAKDMQAIIDEYEKKQKEVKHVNVQNNRCDIDSDFAGVVQQLSTASDRHSRSAKRTKKLR